MVTVSEQHDDECPRCRLRRALEQHLVEAATGTEQAWRQALLEQTYNTAAAGGVAPGTAAGSGGNVASQSGGHS